MPYIKLVKLSIFACLVLVMPVKAELVKNYSESSDSFDFDIALSNGHSSVILSSIANSEEGRVLKLHSPLNEKSDFIKDIKSLIKDEKKSSIFSNPWCDSLKSKMPADVVCESSLNGKQIYSFSPVPSEGDNKKIFENLQARIEILQKTGQVLSFEMKNSSKFSPAFATAINNFSYSVKCIQLTDQRTAIESVKLLINGKAFFNEFREVLEQTYINYRPSKLN